MTDVLTAEVLTHTTQVLTHILLIIGGLILGSFLNTIIYRLPNQHSLLKHRSFCIHCSNKLQIKDLFPLVSYIVLKGRCRYCGERIPWRYPLVELLTAMVILFCYSTFGFSPLFYKYIFVFASLIAISFIDTEEGIIPNSLVLLLFCWCIIWQVIYPEFEALPAAYGLLIGGGLFYIIAVLSKGGMGGGDIKLMALLGFAVGYPIVFVVFILAFMLGAIIGVALLILGRKTRKDTLPFGPFLCLAYFISVIWGWEMWSWYSFF
jgi:leader peptidase (prepilin peptidase)/N-methyltransferase